MSSARSLKSRFELLGSKPGPGLTEHEILAFRERTGLQLLPFLMGLYQEFNGLHLSDQSNMLCLWPMTRIEEQLAHTMTFDGYVLHRIGDFWMDADFLMVSMDDGMVPAVLESEARIMAPTFEVFLRDLAGSTLEIFPQTPKSS